MHFYGEIFGILNNFVIIAIVLYYIYVVIFFYLNKDYAWKLLLCIIVVGSIIMKNA